MKPSSSRSPWSRRHPALVAVLLLLMLQPLASAAELLPLRVGALKYGTVSWELAVIQHWGLDRKYGFQLEAVELGSPGATVLALQGGSVDMIVSDWLWLNAQRERQRRFRFAPYSSAIGGLAVAPGSAITSLADLRGRRLGVAGGPTDKSWLIFSTYARNHLGIDLAGENRVHFGAPPLLNQLLLRGQLDGVISYWHYNARLASQGARVLLRSEDLLEAMAMDDPVPVLGWVFADAWSLRHPGAAGAWLAAGREARQLLLDSDAAWEVARPKMGVASEAEFQALRRAFREGVPLLPENTGMGDLKRLHAVLARASDHLAAASPFQPEAFWWLPQPGP